MQFENEQSIMYWRFFNAHSSHKISFYSHLLKATYRIFDISWLDVYIFIMSTYFAQYALSYQSLLYKTQNLYLQICIQRYKAITIKDMQRMLAQDLLNPMLFLFLSNSLTISERKGSATRWLLGETKGDGERVRISRNSMGLCESEEKIGIEKQYGN